MQNNKGGVIFILLDGCRLDAAAENMGYVEHLIEQGKGAKLLVYSQLPSSSRPLYETLFTGLPAWKHGIVNNRTARVSRCENVFSLCRKNGLSTAAAAYHWISELYVKAPFGPEDRIQLEDSCGVEAGAVRHGGAHECGCGVEVDAVKDGGALKGGKAIQKGIYYFEDSYPDSLVFLDGQHLLKGRPDFLLLHTMNIDDAGHRFGGESLEYHQAVMKADILISQFMSGWLSAGYQVVITADHGMTGLGLHNGNTGKQREVPLYLISPKVKPGDFSGQRVDQLFVAPLLCRLLSIEPGSDMIPLERMEVKLFE